MSDVDIEKPMTHLEIHAGQLHLIRVHRNERDASAYFVWMADRRVGGWK
jgi:hypothetical protein